MNTPTPKKCIVCGKPLAGRLDTFGPIGQEQCWSDWSPHLDWKYSNIPSIKILNGDGSFIEYAGNRITIGIEDDTEEDEQ